MKPYRDTVGKLTIGYGRNLSDVGISKEEAEMMLDNDVRKAYDLAVQICRAKGVNFQELPCEAKVVLVDMAFNLGSRLSGFRKMFECLHNGDFEGAAREMLDSLWARQVGARAMRLAEMMRRAGKGGEKGS